MLYIHFIKEAESEPVEFSRIASYNCNTAKMTLNFIFHRQYYSTFLKSLLKNIYIS